MFWPVFINYKFLFNYYNKVFIAKLLSFFNQNRHCFLLSFVKKLHRLLLL